MWTLRRSSGSLTYGWFLWRASFICCLSCTCHLLARDAVTYAFWGQRSDEYRYVCCYIYLGRRNIIVFA